MTTHDDRRLAVRHSADFVAAWRSVWCGVYRWRRAGRFAMVPSLLIGRPVYSYLPGLSYSDLDEAAAQDLAREVPNHPFNIRVLAAPRPEGALAPGASVVLRIDLAAYGGPEAVWERGLNRKARGSVRRARKAGLTASEETGPGAMQAFCAMQRLAHARHGAPMLPEALFDALVTELGARILVVRSGANGAVQAGYLWVRDGPIAWLPYGGAYRNSDCPGNLAFWAAVELTANEGAEILDFGRSPMGSGTYAFKRSFGARPVPVRWLSDKPSDLYGRYRTAQKLWRALPDFVTDRAGPWLCRYLADF